jgi:hypothetical protein
LDVHRESKNLTDKVKDWLQQQGYPLEFRTSFSFQSAGFDVFQGLYVRESKTNVVREIDVLARVRGQVDKFYFDVSIIAECKWSRDKPWVVFTAPRTRMAPSACIAQSISSTLCDTAMYCLAANKYLHAFELFSSRERNGFGGRRVFSNDGEQDHFYSTVQSIVSKALNFVAEADEDRRPNKAPDSGSVVFPLIVLEGELFEAFFSQDTKEVCVNPVDLVRLHWRGAEDPSQWISTVDVVRFSHLDKLLATRKKEMEKLRDEIREIIPKLVECYKTSSLAPLGLQKAAHGYIGLPELLSEIRLLEKKAQVKS